MANAHKWCQEVVELRFNEFLAFGNKILKAVQFPERGVGRYQVPLQLGGILVGEPFLRRRVALAACPVLGRRQKHAAGKLVPVGFPVLHSVHFPCIRIWSLYLLEKALREDVVNLWQICCVGGRVIKVWKPEAPILFWVVQA